MFQLYSIPGLRLYTPKLHNFAATINFTPEYPGDMTNREAGMTAQKIISRRIYLFLFVFLFENIVVVFTPLKHHVNYRQEGKPRKDMNEFCNTLY